MSAKKMGVTPAIQRQADKVTREHPNHVVGSAGLWHWSYYHSGYGMAEGWAASRKAARDARNQAIGEFVSEGDL